MRPHCWEHWCICVSFRWAAASADALEGEASSYWAGGIYHSVARIVLVGHGADEQCAAYGRHRSRFRTNVRRYQKLSSRPLCLRQKQQTTVSTSGDALACACHTGGLVYDHLVLACDSECTSVAFTALAT